MKRKFTDKQIAIIELISEKKKEGCELMSLDEVAERVARWGFPSTRNSLIISMNILIRHLVASGIYIEKVDELGRGARQNYRIKKA